MKRWTAKIKEVGNPNILTPSYMGDADKEFLIKFWGLNEPDVEWYELNLESED